MTHFESTPSEPGLPYDNSDSVPGYGDNFTDDGTAGWPIHHDIDPLTASTGDAYRDTGIHREPDETPGHDMNPLSDAPLRQGDTLGAPDRIEEQVMPFEVIAAQRRQPIMDRLGQFNDESGVDTERVQRFGEALGLQAAGEHLILSNEHLPDLQEEFDHAGIEASALRSGDGRYVRSLGLTVVNRSTTMPGWWTESTLLHEKIGHGSQGESDQPSIHLSDEELLEWRPVDGKHRAGFMDDTGAGVFFEEGFNHWLSVEYQWRTGLDMAENDPFEIDPTASEKYRFAESYNPAAIAMELLFARDPELIELTFAARRDDEAYETMMRRIGDINPELPAALMSVAADYWGDATGELFGEGLVKVLNATGFNREDIEDIATNGPGTQHIARKLEEYSQRTGFRFNYRERGYPNR